MYKQPEQILEENLVVQLRLMQYDYVPINGEKDLLANLIEGAKPTVLEREKVVDRVLSKVMRFLETFIRGIELSLY